MPEAVNGTGESQPADDIRSALAAAIASSEEPETPEPKPAKAAGEAEAPPAGEPQAKPEGDGGEAEPVAREELDAKDAAGEKDVDKVDPDKPDAGKKATGDAPANWTAKDKDTFKTLPPAAQEFLLRRTKEMEAGFTKKTQEIADFRKRYDPVEKIFEPYRDRMKQGGWTESKLIEGWAGVEKRLMEGDGVNVVAGLISGYKIDLAKVATALGLRPTQPAPRADGEAPPRAADAQTEIQFPPEVTQALTELRARVDARDRQDVDAAQRAKSAAEERVMSDIEKFKSAQDDKGQLLHPHFGELEDDMSQLAAAAIAAKKPVPSLPDLYEKAVWANPSTRDAALAAREKAQQAKSAADARAKAAAAKKAGSSVTGAPGSGQAPQNGRSATRTLREELEANAAEAAQSL